MMMKCWLISRDASELAPYLPRLNQLIEQSGGDKEKLEAATEADPIMQKLILQKRASLTASGLTADEAARVVELSRDPELKAKFEAVAEAALGPGAADRPLDCAGHDAETPGCNPDDVECASSTRWKACQKRCNTKLAECVVGSAGASVGAVIAAAACVADNVRCLLECGSPCS